MFSGTQQSLKNQKQKPMLIGHQPPQDQHASIVCVGRAEILEDGEVDQQATQSERRPAAEGFGVLAPMLVVRGGLRGSLADDGFISSPHVAGDVQPPQVTPSQFFQGAEHRLPTTCVR